MSKYCLLNDKNWLYQKYIKEKKSTVKICKLVGAKTANSVRQYLLKYNIPVRTIGDGLRKKNDNLTINQSVIEGCLLGDGYLKKWNKDNVQSYPYFAKRNKYYDHIKFVAQMLFKEKWSERVKECNETSLGKKQTVFALRSLSNKILQPYYEKWYPKWNNYKKVIPEDIEITSELLLHWFLDDGNSYQRRKDSKTKQIMITLCTECFTKNNQEMIQIKIEDRLKLSFKFKKVNYGTGWRLYLPQSQAQLFYNVIGACPVSSMEYKWK